MVKLPGDAAPQSFDFEADETRLPEIEQEQEAPVAALPPVPQKPEPAQVESPKQRDDELLSELRALGGKPVEQPAPDNNRLLRELNPVVQDILWHRDIENSLEQSRAVSESKARETKGIKTGTTPQTSKDTGWYGEQFRATKEVKPRPFAKLVGEADEARKAGGLSSLFYSSPEQQKEWGQRNLEHEQARIKRMAESVQEAERQIEAWKTRNPGQDVPEFYQNRLERRIAQQRKYGVEAELKAKVAKDIAEGRAPGPQLNVFEHYRRAVGQSFVSLVGTAVASAGDLGQLMRRVAGDKSANIADGTWRKSGEAIQAYAQELFPTDPLRQQEFATQVAYGIGSVGAFYGAGGAAAMAGRLARMSPSGRALFGAAVSAAVGGLVGGGEGVERVMKHVRKGGKVTNRDVMIAYMLTATGGLSEALPVLSWLRSKQGGDVVAGLLEQSLEEMVQEGGQTAWQNYVEQILYNPERNVMDGVVDAAAVGFFTGGIAEGAKVAVSPLMPGAKEDQQQTLVSPPEQPSETPAEPGQTPTRVSPTAAPTGQDAEAELPQATTTPTEGEPVAPKPARTAEESVASGETVAAEPYTPPTGTTPSEVVTPDGSMRLDTETVLVELDDLKYASGDLQPRDRTRMESDIGVRERAANLDPGRLMPERVSDSGAPIITADGTIVSGNGRVMSLEQVYGSQQLGDRAQAYRRQIGAAEGMNRPVLVRRITSQLSPAELRKFADLSNRSSIAQMSATERAGRDAEAAGDAIQLYQGGSFEAPQNREFLRAFVESAVTPSERGSMARNGRLTKEGEDRLRGALLAASYADTDALTRMLESRDDNVRALSGAMLDVAGLVQQLKASIARGETDPAFDITPQITEAAQRISQMRDDGVRPADALAQEDAFERLDPVVEALIRGFYNESLTRPVSRKKMTELLTLYLEEAKKHSGQEGLIPDETTPQDVIDYALAEARSVDPELFDAADAAVGDLLASGEGAAGGPDAGDGRTDRGSEPASGGQAAATQDEDVNLNTAEFAAKFIRNETEAPVDQDQINFFNDLFGPQDAAPQVDTLPTNAMRAAFSKVLAGKAPRSRWGNEVDALIDGDITEDQLYAMEREALDQGLLREVKGGQVRRTPKAKTESLRPRGPVTETATQEQSATQSLEVQPEADARGQTSLLPAPTTQDEIAAEANRRRGPGAAQQDAGGLFSDAVNQTDLADFTQGPQPIDVSGIQSVEDLTTFLRGFGIDTEAYGTGEAKSLNALLGELQKGESQLFNRNGKLVRSVSSLALDIYVSRPDGTRLKLYEDRQDFRDGRTRRRQLDSSLGEKLEPGEDPQATIARALEEEIGVTTFTQTSDVTSYNNSLYSPSYPGILGEYTTYRASVDIDPDQYQDEYVEEQAEKVNVMNWFPIEDGDERSPNIPGSPYNMERRENEARDYMQSGTHTFEEGSDAPASLHGRTVSYFEATKTSPDNDTSQQPGYWSDEWKAARRYAIKDADGNRVEATFDQAIDYLYDTFLAEAGGADAVARDRKAYIVIGLPGAGKSTLIDPMAGYTKAVHVVADETKKIIPEFDHGANSGGVHEESSDLTKLVQARLMAAGYNLALEKIGGTTASIETAIEGVVTQGYEPQLFFVDVPTAVAMERAIGRFQATGRAVSENVYDAEISETYAILKEREEVVGYGRFEWQEPNGWQWQETGSDDLAGFEITDKFSGKRIAYDRDGGLRVGPLGGPDRRSVDRETPDQDVSGRDRQAPADLTTAREIPGQVVSDLADNDFARERAEAAIEAFETASGEMADNQLLEDVLRVETARSSVEATEAAVAEISGTPGFRKPDALRLADIAGYPTKSRTTKQEALNSIADRTRDMIANREVAELIVEGDEDAVLREDAGDLFGGTAPGDVRQPEEGGQAGGALQGSGAGGDRAQGGDRGPTADGAEQGGPAGDAGDAGAAGRVLGDPAEGQRDRIDRDRVRAVVAEKEAERRARRVSNYQITPEDGVGKGTEKQKVRANLDAIRTLRTLEAENRPATPEEQAALARYTGWGAFAQALFDDRSESNAKKWAKERAELKDLVSPDEYAAARESTLNAHFTSPDVVDGMWEAMRYLGFNGGRVLEPAAGSGNFIGMMPADLMAETDWSAVELDQLTGAIADKLYPGADVRIAGFETQNWPDNFFDASISNVPFGQYKLRDTTNKDYKGLLIHDYFIVKGLDKVRPGGLVAYITSSGTMDKSDARARKLMAKRADLVGAIRLPGGNQGAFAANAGTEVTTDILIFQKRGPGQEAADTSWTETVEHNTPEGPTRINAYFAANPKMMLGKMRLTGTMYRKDSPVLIGPTDKMGERILKAVRDNIPQDIFVRGGEAVVDQIADDVDTDATAVKEGAYYEKDGKLFRRVAGVGQPVKTTQANERKIKAFLPVRDAYNKLLGDQARGIKETGDSLRAELNKVYDAFVKKFGPIQKTTVSVTKRTDSRGNQIVIRKRPNLDPLKADPDAYKVASLEAYDENTGKAAKAAVFEQDVLIDYQRPAIQSESDALAISLNERGKVDVPFLAKTLEMSEEEVIESLGDMVFLNPANREYETAAVYLSGDVVGKLEDARRAAETDSQFARHVDALEEVQPPPLTRVDIRILMGAPWVNVRYYNQFLEQEVGGRNVTVTWLPASKKWKLENGFFDADVRNKWGHGRAELPKIIEAALNNTTIRVTDSVSDGEGGKTEVVNQEATEEVQSRIDALRNAFSGAPELGVDGWVWSDEQRAQELEGIYNASFNRLVSRTYDGSHLTFPGMARVLSFPDGSKGEIRLPEYRTGVIWRIISEGNTLMAHGVGSGKTFSSIMSGMEQKRLGLIQRPAYVVPNHMLEQFTTEFLQVYPGAKLLVADKDSMSKDKRKEFAARVAAERWDGVIITHDAFGRVQMSNDYVQEFMASEIEAMVEMESQAKAEGDGRDLSVKDIERKRKNLEDRLQKLMNAERKDDGITFEEMGVDFLYVDEAHLFKNLNFNTKQGGIKGLSQRPSQRAYDLFMKIQYLEKSRPGRSAVFMTGTPVSNSIAELYTMMRYLQKPVMEEYGIDEFDAWLQSFAEVTSQPEIAPNGRDVRDTRSISKFVNLPELMNIYGMVADVQTPAMLNLPTPELEGGAPIIVEAELSDAEEAIMTDIVRRSEEVKGKRPEKGEDNILSVMSDGLKLATDVRLLQPDQPVNPDSKVGKAIDNIVKEYEQGGQAPALAQIVFLDMGVPQSTAKAKKASDDNGDADLAGDDIEMMRGNFDLYNDIKARLIERGIPKDEIAFIHDANNDIKKARLFKAVKEGRVRVLLGTTGKMGVGTNVQKNLVAMHHIDAPWRPADLEQRDGRIMRQGNDNESVRIYRYITTRSLDAVRWQQLERKAGFIAQLAAGARGLREAEDIDSPLPEASQIKAAASGDPRIMEHAELTKEVRVVEAQKRTAERQVIAARKRVEEMTARRDKVSEALPVFEADAAKIQDLSGENFVMSVDVGRSGAIEMKERKKAGEAIKTYLMAYIERGGGYGRQRLTVGKISGLQAFVELERRVMKGEMIVEGRVMLSGEQDYFAESNFTVDEDMNPVSLVQRFERAMSRIPEMVDLRQRELAQLDDQIPKLVEQSQFTAFPREAELTEMKTRLRELELALDPEKRAKAEAAEAKAAEPAPEPDAALRNIGNMIGASLKRGNTVSIANAVVRQVREGIAEDLRLAPADHDVGILTKLEPIDGTDKVRATFTDPRTESVFTFDRSWRDIAELRAARLPEKLTSTGRPAIITAHLGALGISPRGLRGELRHEIIHALRRSGRLSDASFDRLVDHADTLGVLDMEADAFFAATGVASDPFGPGVTLFDIYLERENWRDKADLREVIFQEAIAHMVELNTHGYYSTDQMAPVQDLLDQFERGEMTGGDQVPTDAMAAALRASAPEATAIEDIPADVDAPHPGPVIAYHGTAKDFQTFDPSMSSDIGIHFGTVAQANDRIGNDEYSPTRVVPVVLDLDNPITFNDLGTWEPRAIYQSARRQGVEFTEAEQAIFDAPSIEEPGAVDEVLQRAIQRAGYDGIRYLNRTEGVDTGNAVMLDKNGDATSGWSYIVWEPGKVRSALTDDVLMAMRAFHYSPYDFDRFDMRFIGAGEGAQVFGTGLYFAENTAVTDQYKINLSVKAEGVRINGRGEISRAATYVRNAIENNEPVEELPKFLRFFADRWSPDLESSWGTEEQLREGADQIEKWVADGVTFERDEGTTYEVELDVEPDQLLDYDLDLSEQPPAIKDALKRVARKFKWEVRANKSKPTWATPSYTQYRVWLNDRPYGYDFMTREEAEADLESTKKRHLARIEEYVETPGTDVAWLLRGPSLEEINYSPEHNPEQGISRLGTSKSLADLMLAEGIPGIRYFDQGSRTRKLGTRNIVIFDDSLVTIKAKNGDPVTAEERDMVLARITRAGEQRPQQRVAPDAPVTERFAEAAPEYVDALLDYVRKITPDNVAIRLADNIEYFGQEIGATYSPTKRLITLSMQMAPDQAFATARHESIHVARMMGLFSPQEWQVLTERAAKVAPDLYDGGYYETIYSERARKLGLTGGDLNAYVAEYVNQERVAFLAESWQDGAKYGSRIEGFLKRIQSFIEALANAARGLGFQTANDIFAKVESGEVADRRQTSPEAQGALAAYGLADAPAANTRAWDLGTVEMRKTDDGRRVRTYMSDTGAVSVIENDTGTWAVQSVNTPNAEATVDLLAAIEDDTGQYLAPNGWLTTDQYERWLEVEPQSVRGHQQTGGLFYGLWAPPAQIDLAADVAGEVIGRTDDATLRAKAGRMASELRSLRNQMAPSVLPAVMRRLPGQYALGSQGQGSDSTDSPSARLSELVNQFNDEITAAPAILGTGTASDRANAQRQGRMNPAMRRRATSKGGWLAGLYNRATGVTRLEIPNDFVTLSHEGGHALETRADTRDVIEQIKRQYAHDLLIPPAPPSTPKPFAPAGFSGLEIDAQTQETLVRAYQAEMQLRAGNVHPRQQSILQSDVDVGMAGLERNLGEPAASMVMDDMVRRGVPPGQAAADVAIRYSATGQPQPRIETAFEVALANAEAFIQQQPAIAGLPALAGLRQNYTARELWLAMDEALTSGQVSPRSALGRQLRQRQTALQRADDALSEAWGDWFQAFVTAPERARSQSPALANEFMEVMDGEAPSALNILEEIQTGYQSLITASAVEALRSRVGTTFRPGRWATWNERRRNRTTMQNIAMAPIDLHYQRREWQYEVMKNRIDQYHPLKVARNYLADLAVLNSGEELARNEQKRIWAIDDPYQVMRLAEHAKAHAMSVLQDGVAFGGNPDGSGATYNEALTTAFGGSAMSKWNDDSIEKFGAYLIARRLEAEWQRYDREELPNAPDQLISRDAINKARADLEAENPQFIKAADKIYEFQRNILTWKYEQGFLTEEQYNDYIAREDYAPLNRIVDRYGAAQSLSSARGTNKAKMIHRFLGSTRDFINPLESIIQDVHSTQARVELNHVIRNLDRVATAAGPGGGAIAERIPANDMRATQVDLRAALKSAARKQGLDEQSYDHMMDEIDLLFDAEVSASIFSVTEANERGEQIIWLWEDGKRVPILLGEHKVARDVFDMFTAFGQHNVDSILEAATLTSTVLRTGVTKDPAYIVVNYVRDQMQNGILSRTYTPFVTGMKGLWTVSPSGAAAVVAGTAGAFVGGLTLGAPLLVGAGAAMTSALATKAITTAGGIDREALRREASRYNRYAGLFGGIDASLINTSSQEHDIRAMRTKGFWAVPGGTVVGRTWNGFLKAMEITEAGSRVGHFKAAYDRAIAEGMPPTAAYYEAAYAAHDVMDFSRRGALMGPITQLIPFLNAQIQGLDVGRRTIVTGERNVAKLKGPDTYRELASPYIKAMNGQTLKVAEKENLPLSARAFLKILSLGMVGMVLTAYYDDDEEYQQFNDYMRATHWFFKVGGYWFRFPKPFELAFFSNLFEAGYTGFYAGNPERANKQFMESLRHTLLPPFQPQLAQLWYEAWMGKDTFGDRPRDIVGMDISRLPPELQYNAYSSEFSKMMAASFGKIGIEMSPAMVDHMFTGAFASVGRSFLTETNTALPALNRQLGGAIPGVRLTPAPETSIEHRAFISRFMRDPSRGALATQYFWQQMAPEGGKFVAARSGYKSLYESGQIPNTAGERAGQRAQALLMALKPEERAYAMLGITDNFNANHRRLHPLERARAVLGVGRNLMKDMLSDTGIVREATKDDTRETIHLTPADQKKVREILSDISMREAHNALVLVGVEGIPNKDQYMEIDHLHKELRVVAPDVADEYEARQKKKSGERSVLKWDDVRRLWPQAKERVLKDGFDAAPDLTDLYHQADLY